ncbi:O-antigen ligase [Lentimonas sp. CC19]|uniref:O-antigen ligase family protein n=1 Tax=Lentimonas sp. CC19 TaxID=2676097 RepID=UPI00138A2089|nr:O-antigen ligase family protein [Lentimonas sp. CC19]
MTFVRTGLGGKYLICQTCLLVLFSVWSLGGRAEGAIFGIACIAWASLFALALHPPSIIRLKDVFAQSGCRVMLGAWCILILFLLLAPLNSEGLIESLPDGLTVYQPRETVAWFPTTFVRERCLEYGFLLSGVLVQVMVLWHFIDRFGRVRLLLTVFAGNALVVAILGAGFRLLGSDQILGIYEPVADYFFGVFRYHNHWTAFALLSMGQCLALVLYWYQAGSRDADIRRQHLDVVWAGALLILSFTLPMSTARAGVLFLAIFWVCLGTVFAKWAYRRSLPRLGLLRGIVPVFTFILMLGVIVYSIRLSSHELHADWDETLAQMEQLQNGDLAQIDAPRTDSWGDCWRMFKDRPLYGSGFGSHRYLYQLYARDQYRYESGVVRHVKEFAHNDLMQYLAEFGVIGLFLLCMPPVTLLIRYYRAILASPFACALLFSCGLILMLASFEFPLSNPAIIVIFSIQLTLALKVAMIDLNFDRVASVRLKNEG